MSRLEKFWEIVRTETPAEIDGVLVSVRDAQDAVKMAGRLPPGAVEKMESANIKAVLAANRLCAIVSDLMDSATEDPEEVSRALRDAFEEVRERFGIKRAAADGKRARFLRELVERFDQGKAGSDEVFHLEGAVITPAVARDILEVYDTVKHDATARRQFEGVDIKELVTVANALLVLKRHVQRAKEDTGAMRGAHYRARKRDGKNN